MRLSRAAAFALFVVVLAGCGQAVVAESQPAQGAETIRTTLYFLAENGSVPLGVRRTIIKDSPPPEGSTLRGALNALLGGPTDEERQAGITSAIPPGTELVSLTWRDFGATVFVDLSGLSTVDHPLDRARVTTQIVRTLVGVSSTQRIWLRENGQPWGMYLMEGGVTNGPFAYETLGGFWLGAGCPGTETVECDSFKALP
jgi:spore germination protein GerM